jgi:leader peptidase (prepilin peptidase)/N-methyltransferase
LREVVFLLPIAVGAAGAYLLVTKISPVAAAWREVWDWGGGRVGAHLGGLFAAVFGYFIAGLWIWGVRILGTLAFGKEAMGLGDAHLLAAVGAVAGWRTATTAFFLAPVLGLLWAIRLWARKGQRELPYGPWLSLAAAVALLFHDQLLALLEMYRNATRAMF